MSIANWNEDSVWSKLKVLTPALNKSRGSSLVGNEEITRIYQSIVIMLLELGVSHNRDSMRLEDGSLDPSDALPSELAAEEKLKVQSVVKEREVDECCFLRQLSKEQTNTFGSSKLASGVAAVHSLNTIELSSHDSPNAHLRKRSLDVGGQSKQSHNTTRKQRKSFIPHHPVQAPVSTAGESSHTEHASEVESSKGNKGGTTSSKGAVVNSNQMQTLNGFQSLSADVKSLMKSMVSSRNKVLRDENEARVWSDLNDADYFKDADADLKWKDAKFKELRIKKATDLHRLNIAMRNEVIQQIVPSLVEDFLAVFEDK